MINQLVTSILFKLNMNFNTQQLQMVEMAIRSSMDNFEISLAKNALMELDDSTMAYLDVFLMHKNMEGRSPQTIEAYRLCLKKMLLYINKPVAYIKENDLYNYLMQYKNIRKVSNRTTENMRLIICSFFSWMFNKKYIPDNPASGISKIKCEKKVVRPFSDEDLDKMRSCCATKRDRAIVEFLYSTGVRISEMIQLNRDDVNLGTSEIVVRGKGNKERTVYLTPTASMHLKEYLETRKDKEIALFSCLNYGRRMTKSGYKAMFKRLESLSGVENIHAHKFRHTVATNVLKRGMPVEEVQQMLGHEGLNTTMIYCFVNKDNVKHSHRKYMSL